APAGGSVIVFPGASSQVATGFWLNENDAGEPIVSGDKFGASVAAGNTDGDAYADLLIGAPGANSTAGAAYLFGGRPRESGGTRSLQLGHRLAQPDVGWGNESGDNWGSAVALGDVNHDGTADALVGDAGEAPAGTTTHSGATATITGLTTGLSLGPIARGPGPDPAPVGGRGNHPRTLHGQDTPVRAT